MEDISPETLKKFRETVKYEDVEVKLIPYIYMASTAGATLSVLHLLVLLCRGSGKGIQDCMAAMQDRVLFCIALRPLPTEN